MDRRVFLAGRLPLTAVLSLKDDASFLFDCSEIILRTRLASE